MADERLFERLLAEFRRVGIDPNTFSAMLAINADDALRALESLPDGAGPAAFLAELRRQGVHAPSAREPHSHPRSDEGRASA